MTRTLILASMVVLSFGVLSNASADVTATASGITNVGVDFASASYQDVTSDVLATGWKSSGTSTLSGTARVSAGGPFGGGGWSRVHAEATDAILLDGQGTANVTLTLTLDTNGNAYNPYGGWSVDATASVPGVSSLSLGALQSCYYECMPAMNQGSQSRSAQFMVSTRRALQHDLWLASDISTSWDGTWHSDVTGASSIRLSTQPTSSVRAKLMSRLTPSDILDGSMQWVADGSGVIGVFQPKFGLSLSEAAELLGVEHFNFLNLVAVPPIDDMSDPRLSGIDGLPPSTLRADGSVKPYWDSIPGGYDYQRRDYGVPIGTPVRDSFPTYLDELFPPPPGSFLFRDGVPITSSETIRDVWTNDTNREVVVTEGSAVYRIPPHGMIFRDYPGGPSVVFSTILAGVRQDQTGIEAFDYEGTSRVWYTDGQDSEILRENGTNVPGNTGYLLAPTLPGSLPADVVSALQSEGISILSRIQGDINGDGVVTRTDVAMFAEHFGRTDYAWFADGDFDGDHRVTLQDLALLQAHLTPLAASSSAVPEPSTACLSALALAMLFVCRVRRRQ